MLTSEVPAVVEQAHAAIRYEVDSISKLSEAASKHPYYKWNQMWTRHVQDSVGLATVPVYRNAADPVRHLPSSIAVGSEDLVQRCPSQSLVVC
jgi:thiamine biosynthesis protein ThiC